ncbi:hypothetical protein [Virgibacillus sp. JSM 102003]|uniref:hypothetical protein n=1 Tax=Virgibacillus sp. JSM 102003 TaxID=1562108 RepID=UPI0035C131FA
MIKQWTKIHTYWLLGVLLATFIVYGVCYFTVIAPLQSKVSTLDKKVSMYENQFKKTESQSKESPSEELSALALQVPRESSPDDVLLNLQTIASDTNVTIDYIESANQSANQAAVQQEEEEATELNENSYSLDATASKLSDINSFLAEMTDSKRLMIIESINLQQDAKQVYLTVSFKTFYTG